MYAYDDLQDTVRLFESGTNAKREQLFGLGGIGRVFTWMNRGERAIDKCMGALRIA